MSLPLFSLRDLKEVTTVSHGYRAQCPVHGGKNASALLVNAETGVGYCFVCSKAVLLINNISPSFGRTKRGSVAPTARTSSSWQVAEHEVLCELQARMSAALVVSPRASAYMREREIPLWVAARIGIGYLSRLVLNEPAYASRTSLLSRWVDSVVFPLSSRVVDAESGQEAYVQGYIGRTLKKWSPGLNEDEHKKLLDEYNAWVRIANEQGARKNYPILRWVKTKEPAGFFYPATPALVGSLAVLVEGGWDTAAVAACLAHLPFSKDPVLPVGSVIGLAGTTIHPEQLPAQVKGVLLALDDDEVGRERMLLLREAFLQADVPTYSLAQRGEGQKDWSARWRISGVAGVRPLVDAYRYVATWLAPPRYSIPCLILVDELADALALLDAATVSGYSIDACHIAVLNGGLTAERFLQVAPQVVVLASVTPVEGSQDAVQKALVAQQERTQHLLYEIARRGVRVFHCPPPDDGWGATWEMRWKLHGCKGVSLVFDAYRDVQTVLS